MPSQGRRTSSSSERSPKSYRTNLNEISQRNPNWIPQTKTGKQKSRKLNTEIKAHGISLSIETPSISQASKYNYHLGCAHSQLDSPSLPQELRLQRSKRDTEELSSWALTAKLRVRVCRWSYPVCFLRPGIHYDLFNITFYAPELRVVIWVQYFFNTTFTTRILLSILSNWLFFWYLKNYFEWMKIYLNKI